MRQCTLQGSTDDLSPLTPSDKSELQYNDYDITSDSVINRVKIDAIDSESVFSRDTAFQRLEVQYEYDQDKPTKLLEVGSVFGHKEVARAGPFTSDFIVESPTA